MGRDAIQILLKKWMLGIMEVLVALPFIIYIWTSFIDTGSMYAWLSVILWTFLVGILLELWKPNKRRGFYAFFSILISVVVAMLLTTILFAFIFTGIFVMVMVLRGVLYGREPLGDPFSVLYLLGGFFIYFFAFFFYREIASLAPYQTFLTWSGVVLVLFTLFQANQQYLREATLSNERKPYVAKVVRVRNQIAVAILVGIAFLITSAQYVEVFLSRIIGFIGSLIPSSSSEEVESPSPQVDNMAPDLGLGDEIKEPSRFFEMLETVMTYVVGAIVILGSLFILIVIYKAFRKHIFRMVSWLLGAITKLGGSSEKEEEEIPYVDEKMSIRDWRAWREKNKEKFKDWVSAPFQKEQTMEDFTTRREKIRFLYCHSLGAEIKKGYQFRENATPWETLLELVEEDRQLVDLSEQELADVYAKVRYGEEDVSDQEFERVFRKGGK